MGRFKLFIAPIFLLLFLAISKQQAHAFTISVSPSSGDFSTKFVISSSDCTYTGVIDSDLYPIEVYVDTDPGPGPGGIPDYTVSAQCTILGELKLLVDPSKEVALGPYPFNKIFYVKTNNSWSGEFSNVVSFTVSGGTLSCGARCDPAHNACPAGLGACSLCELEGAVYKCQTPPSNCQVKLVEPLPNPQTGQIITVSLTVPPEMPRDRDLYHQKEVLFRVQDSTNAIAFQHAFYINDATTYYRFGPLGKNDTYKLTLKVKSPADVCSADLRVQGASIADGYTCDVATGKCSSCAGGPGCVWSEESLCSSFCGGAPPARIIPIRNCSDSLFQTYNAKRCSCELAKDITNTTGTVQKAPFAKPGTWTAIGCIPNDPQAAMVIILRFISGLIGGIAFLALLRGTLLILTSQGDPERINQGKDWIVSAVVGLVFMTFSTIVLAIIGVDIIRIPGFRR